MRLSLIYPHITLSFQARTSRLDLEDTLGLYEERFLDRCCDKLSADILHKTKLFLFLYESKLSKRGLARKISGRYLYFLKNKTENLLSINDEFNKYSFNFFNTQLSSNSFRKSTLDTSFNLVGFREGVIAPADFSLN